MSVLTTFAEFMQKVAGGENVEQASAAAVKSMGPGMKAQMGGDPGTALQNTLAGMWKDETGYRRQNQLPVTMPDRFQASAKTMTPGVKNMVMSPEQSGLKPATVTGR